MNRIIFSIITTLFLFTGQISWCQDGTKFKYDPDVNIRLLEASERGDFFEVKECLRKGAKVNSETYDGVTALMYATAIGNESIVKLLLEKGAKVNAQPYNGLTPLITASQLGLTNIAEALINDSANLNLADFKGATALHYSSLYNSDTIVFMLLQSGAKVNKLTNDSTSSLSLAAINGSYESAFLLLEAGANVNTRDKYGFTPLMLASQKGYTEVVSLLVNNGANVNLQNNKGYSALSLAITNGYPDIVKLLIQNGSNPKETNSLSINPKVLAKLSNDTSILNTIKKAHVRSNVFPAFKTFATGMELSVSSGDIMTGFYISQKDIKFGLEYNFGFYLRPKAVQIQKPIPDFGYYQFRERRYMFTFDLTKNFTLIRNNNVLAGVNLGARGIYSFGHYRGTSIQINGGPNIASVGWLYLRNDRLEGRLGYYYTNYSEKDLSSSHITLGLVYHFVNRYKFDLNRKIKWLD